MTANRQQHHTLKGVAWRYQRSRILQDAVGAKGVCPLLWHLPGLAAGRGDACVAPTALISPPTPAWSDKWANVTDGARRGV